jgi:hypothetical protein
MRVAALVSVHAGLRRMELCYLKLRSIIMTKHRLKIIFHTKPSKASEFMSLPRFLAIHVFVLYKRGKNIKMLSLHNSKQKIPESS